ncbi:MAG: pyridoxal phosphate-dependent aminotransferase [Planctomycetota bacterium]
MPISQEVKEALTRSSWIRRMFEEGHRLKTLHGADEVFDFTLGNPDLPPPERFLECLRELTAAPPGEIHRYMPNAGWPHVREKVASHLEKRTGLPFRGEHVVMTVGAGGALNVCLKSLLDPGDEVIILSPYFVEYLFYIGNHDGRVVPVETGEDFAPPTQLLEEAIGERTRAVIINSPNNPTGRVYSRAELEEFVEVLRRGAARIGSPIYLITDEPYRKIVYDGLECPEIPPLYDDTIVITSHSKDLGLAGERIGYVTVSPRAAEVEDVVGAFTFCNRTLGYVNAPSLFQLAVADCQEISVELGPYKERRDLLLGHLEELGFDVQRPGGAFYLFPRSPIPDEMSFLQRLMEERILVVPGRGFGRAGHFRISYALPTPVIQKSLPAWERVARSFPELMNRTRATAE